MNNEARFHINKERTKTYINMNIYIYIYIYIHRSSSDMTVTHYIDSHMPHDYITKVIM